MYIYMYKDIYIHTHVFRYASCNSIWGLTRSLDRAPVVPSSLPGPREFCPQLMRRGGRSETKGQGPLLRLGFLTKPTRTQHLGNMSIIQNIIASIFSLALGILLSLLLSLLCMNIVLAITIFINIIVMMTLTCATANLMDGRATLRVGIGSWKPPYYLEGRGSTKTKQFNALVQVRVVRKLNGSRSSRSQKVGI